MIRSFISPRFWFGLCLGIVLCSWLWTGSVISQESMETLQIIEIDPPNQAVDVDLEQVFRISLSGSLDDDLERLQVEGKALDPRYTIRVDDRNEIEVDTSDAPEPELVFDINEGVLLLQPTQPLLYGTQYSIMIPSQEVLLLEEDLELTFQTQPQYTYDDEIQPLFDAACVGCHRPQAPLLRSPLHTYEAILEFLEPGNPNSQLLEPRWTRRHARTAPIFGRTGSAARYIRTAANQIPGHEDLYTFDQLGRWTPEQVQRIATWIIQDDAAESSERSILNATDL